MYVRYINLKYVSHVNNSNVLFKYDNNECMKVGIYMKMNEYRVCKYV